MENLPMPRPEYVTETGHAEFKVGDIVRLRDPLPFRSAIEDRGVVTVIRDEWYVVWRSGEIQSFEDIAGDDLIVL